jgi:hypothetical protein
MSAINTGVYPAPNPATIDDITQTQAAEGQDLTDFYDTKNAQLANTNMVYDSNVALFDQQINLTQQNAANKPINTFQKTSYTKILLTAEATQVWVNQNFNPVDADITLYVLLSVNFQTPQVNPIHSILWQCVSNSVLVNEVAQDLGDYVVTDVSTKWVIPFLFIVPSGSAIANNFITAQISSDFVIEEPVQIGVRVYQMDP